MQNQANDYWDDLSERYVIKKRSEFACKIVEAELLLHRITLEQRADRFKALIDQRDADGAPANLRLYLEDLQESLDCIYDALDTRSVIDSLADDDA